MIMPVDPNYKIDPVLFQQELWPNVTLYSKQREILYSIQDNNQTIVTAAHQLGKDFIAAYVVLWYFLTRNTVRIVTTSVKDDHLNVLWGEIGRFIDTCKFPLSVTQGGPLVITHRTIRKLVDKDGNPDPKGTLDKISYLKGMVSLKGEGLTGHHADHTMLVVDEASGVEDMVWERADTWASGGPKKKMFTFGNPYNCTNYFFSTVKAGDIKDKNNGHYIRKIIKIKAIDSPNVRLALGQIANGEEPTHEEIIPGVVTYQGYQERLLLWDDVKICIALNGEFYLGAEVLMYPPLWLDRAEGTPAGFDKRLKTYLGIDPGEGGDDTCWAAINQNGVFDLISKKTPDTSVIVGETLALMRKYNIDPKDVVFDRGGGGKQIADQLRRQRYPVRTIAFGESINPQLRVGTIPLSIRKDQKEEQYAYKNRRAEMYYLLRLQMDETENERGFGIPAKYKELRRQLSPVPLLYDQEGRIKLPPKNKRDKNSKEETMKDLVGCSPDQSDALVLANYGLMYKSRLPKVGALR